MSRRKEPWTTYASWLSERRQLNPTTISTYITLMRRVLRNAGTPLTAEGVGGWIDSLPQHHRSPHRAAYRAFAEWSVEQGHQLPALPSVAVDVPAEVREAIREIVRSGIPIRDLVGLQWDVDNSPAKRAAFPDRTFLRVNGQGRGELAALPAGAAETLRRWAYGDDAPAATDWLVPRGPGAKEALPYPVLVRLLR